jgi:hypothetical protein
MVSNQLLKAGVGAGLVVFLSACTLFGAGRDEAPPPPPPPAAAPQDDVGAEVFAAEEMTATEAAIAAQGSAAQASAEPSTSDTVFNATAPKTYTVQKGDTLWDIASMFLRDPWLWPEIWIVNNQVQNPHLIYPGDVLALAYGADGRPQGVRLERGGAARLNPRLRSEPLEGAIPTLPYQAIAAFLSRPSLVSADEARKAPHVVAFRDGHTIAGAGHEIFVRNLRAEENARFNVMHIGEPLRDPDNGDVLGYEALYTATATVLSAGDVSKAMLSDSERETLRGDRLFSIDEDHPLTFSFKAPRADVKGRIIRVIDGTHLIGQFQIVAINRGSRHGLEPGNVLAIDQAGEVVRDIYGNRRGGMMQLGSSFAPKVKLPDERAGTLLVFRTFDRMSYGLVVGAANEIRVADVVRNP